MTVTVGVPVYEPEERHLRELGASIASLAERTEIDLVVRIDDAGSVDVRRILGDPAISGLCRNVDIQASVGPPGMAANWNRVIEASESEYVVVLGQDDRLEPTGVLQQIRLLDEHPEVNVCGGFRILTNDGGQPLDPAIPMFDRSAIFESGERYLVPGHTARLLLARNGNVFGEPSCLLLRTDAIRAMGAFDTGFDHVADMDLTLRAALTGPIGFVGWVTARRRLHESSLTSANMKSGVAVDERLDLIRRVSATLGSKQRRALASWSNLYALKKRRLRALQVCSPRETLRLAADLVRHTNPDRKVLYACRCPH
ncbi:MAG: glycosyltransferase family 2 protein [Acidimicrobiales bacterium]|nr:glycosyltransferase family 2 protein [Acidimicrobiales bacterium]